MTTADQVIAALTGARFRFTTEAELQDGVELVLGDALFNVEREVVLGARDRIDFMVGGVGIEVKIGESLSAVTRQLHRYSLHDRVEALVLVTSMLKHDHMPARINGREIHVFTVVRAFQ